MGISHALCYVSGGQSLQNTEIGDSLVVRAIEQQATREYSRLRLTAPSWVSLLSQCLQWTTII